MPNEELDALRAENEALLLMLVLSVRALEAASVLERPIAEVVGQIMKGASPTDPRVKTLARFQELLKTGIGAEFRGWK